MLRLLRFSLFVVVAIALTAMPTAVLARAPDALDALQNFEISATPVATAANPVATVLSATSAQTPTDAAIARSMPVISPTLAAVESNIANYPNPSNATAKTITPVTATTGAANDAVQMIATTSADDNFGAVARSGTSLQAAQGANTSHTTLDTSPGVAAGATMRFAA